MVPAPGQRRSQPGPRRAAPLADEAAAEAAAEAAEQPTIAADTAAESEAEEPETEQHVVEPAEQPLVATDTAAESTAEEPRPLSAKEVGLPPDTTKGTDTIDVSIDSGVSHKAVCAVHPELRDPADMYLEATDQHRGWFQSSLMTSIALNNRAPYKICVTHGFVVDLDGKKISKSGTYEKPTAADHFVGR